jgi:RimJ/RimL family protein N-acetyltransferase
MRIERWDPADETTALACYQVHRAANAADEPHEPPKNAGAFGLYLREGSEKTPGEVWVASDAERGVAGYYRMNLPDLENLTRTFGGPVVHPAVRRRGIGGELLRHEAARAAANGREILSSETITGSAGHAFAVAAGATLELEDVRRVQYLAKIAPGTVASLRAAATRAAAGYSLVSWTGDTPEKYLGPLAAVVNACEDAPRGEGVEAEVWDAERLRERTGTLVRAGHLRGHGVAAIHDATGEMAAFTGVVVDPESPEWGFQQLTAVTRPHRGHRLGLLVKTAMLELLAREEPQLARIVTGNAAANNHMIAVNEQLGYEVVEPGWLSYEIPVAKLLGSA